MKFLILALSLLLMSRLPIPQRSTQSRTFQQWLSLIGQWSIFHQIHHFFRWSLVVILPTLLIAILSGQLGQWLWGLPLVALEIILLVYVLSHINIKKLLEDYKSDLASGNVSGAMVCAEQFSAGSVDDKLNKATANQSLATDADKETTAFDKNTHGEEQHLHDEVIQSLLHRWFEYFFLMVFWYVIGDVIGLVLAWSSLQFARSSATDGYAWRYLYWLEWLPARLLGLTYALAGDFSRAIPALRQSLSQWFRGSADVLYDIASHALNLAQPQENEAADGATANTADDGVQQHLQRLEAWQALHWRCVSVWMVVLAVASVGGVLL